MWFHTTFFVPPKKFGYNGESSQTGEGSFSCSTESKLKDGSFTISGEKKE